VCICSELFIDLFLSDYLREAGQLVVRQKKR
jgi:hypothetical protein